MYPIFYFGGFYIDLYNLKKTFLQPNLFAKKHASLKRSAPLQPKTEKITSKHVPTISPLHACASCYRVIRLDVPQTLARRSKTISSLGHTCNLPRPRQQKRSANKRQARIVGNNSHGSAGALGRAKILAGGGSFGPEFVTSE